MELRISFLSRPQFADDCPGMITDAMMMPVPVLGPPPGRRSGPAETYRETYRICQDYIFIRPPGISHGAFELRMDNVWFCKVLLLFHFESNTDVGLKRHSCAFVTVLEEYSGPRRPGTLNRLLMLLSTLILFRLHKILIDVRILIVFILHRILI
jgi:hypothetical protein